MRIKQIFLRTGMLWADRICVAPPKILKFFPFLTAESEQNLAWCIWALSCLTYNLIQYLDDDCLGMNW